MEVETIWSARLKILSGPLQKKSSSFLAALQRVNTKVYRLLVSSWVVPSLGLLWRICLNPSCMHSESIPRVESLEYGEDVSLALSETISFPKWLCCRPLHRVPPAQHHFNTWHFLCYHLSPSPCCLLMLLFSL